MSERERKRERDTTKVGERVLKKGERHRKERKEKERQTAIKKSFLIC